MFSWLTVALKAVTVALSFTGRWVAMNFKNLSLVIGEWTVTIDKTAAAQ